MASTAITLPSNMGRRDFGEVLKLVGLPSEAESTKRQLSGVAEELVRSVVSVIDDLVQRLIETRTEEDFKTVRQEIFPQYFAAMNALGDLLRIVVPQHGIERLISESLSELEADFRERGSSAFGEDLRDRGMFTIWTFRKLGSLVQELSAVQYHECKDTDSGAKMAMTFAGYAIWTRLHVDCLLKAMRTRQPIYPEVVEQIRGGLRAAVDAHAWLRRLVDVRVAAPEPIVPEIAWDDEDETFLADSMRDMRLTGTPLKVSDPRNS